jgi:hypothetical protein
MGMTSITPRLTRPELSAGYENPFLKSRKRALTNVRAPSLTDMRLDSRSYRRSRQIPSYHARCRGNRRW